MHSGLGDDDGRRWQLRAGSSRPRNQREDGLRPLGCWGGLAGLPSGNVLTDALRCVLGLAHGHGCLLMDRGTCRPSCVGASSLELTRLTDPLRAPRPRTAADPRCNDARPVAPSEPAALALWDEV